jgi:MerR family copper efflux transcriptional regulator
MNMPIPHQALEGDPPPVSHDRARMHQIGEVTERVGLSLRTVRHYDEVGLVVPSGRTAGGFRLYTDDDIERLALIKRMKPLDFTLDEMRELLALREQLATGPADAEARATLLRQLQEYASAAARRCDTLRQQLEHAQAFADTLAADVGRW